MFLLAALFSFVSPVICSAEYTSLISASDFDGPKADLFTGVQGLMTIAFVFLGVGLLFKVLSR